MREFQNRVLDRKVLTSWGQPQHKENTDMEIAINGMKAVGYFKDEDKFLKRGEYQETELDKRKREVYFLILGVGNRWEIRFNHQVNLKENRSIKKSEYVDNVYHVTSNAFEKLKKQYSYECDF